MVLAEQEPGSEGDDDLDVESSSLPQPRLPGRLDFPTRHQAAMNVVGQLEFGDPTTAARTFAVLTQNS